MKLNSHCPGKSMNTQVKVKYKSLSRVQLFATSWTVVHGILQARILEWVAFSFSRGSSQTGIKPRFPALQVDSLSTELSESRIYIQ